MWIYRGLYFMSSCALNFMSFFLFVGNPKSDPGWILHQLQSRKAKRWNGLPMDDQQLLSINQSDAPCMKPECFRLASALTNTSPFKSSVPTAHTVEAISMHLPARDTDNVCTRTEMATCLSLLVPALGPLFSLHHFHICGSALITPRSRMILATSSETEWGGWNSNLHDHLLCLLTLVYGLAKSKNVFHEITTPENQPLNTSSGVSKPQH